MLPVGDTTSFVPSALRERRQFGGNALTFKETKLALVAVFLAAAPLCAHSQQPTMPSTEAATRSGWIFNIAPYLWLPSINASIRYDLPRTVGGTLSADIVAPPADYLPDLHFAAMLAAEARHDRFSLLSDFMYMSLAMGSGDTFVRSVSLTGLAPQPLARSIDLGSSSTLKATIWTLAGGHTIVQGPWGNLDLLAGFRLISMNVSTNFNLALTLTSPSGSGATFGGAGRVSASDTIWNGIAGFRGRIRLADTGLFIPYYFDIGTGGSELTWQIASGLGYQTGWAGVSLLGRYLSFEQRSHPIRHLDMAGPAVVVNFTF